VSGDWLRDAVLYEIYPPSFADSDGDGIGDLRGVLAHLDHLASLGVDAIWFNPCFESPFVDGGYDVSDYLRIAPRYGTEDDLVELVAGAGERGIRVILDLVAGHTSIEHPWFRAELAADGPAPDGDRYVWRDDEPVHDWGADRPGIPAWVESPGPRRGWYLKNFYDEQPALNFGWTSTDEREPWRDAVDAPGPRRNREALREVLDHWLGLGVAGFRVDMAFSLVKDAEEGHAPLASVALWREIRAWMDHAYPDAVLIPEGSEPSDGGPPAFHADFALVIHEAHASLFDNHAAGRLPFHPPHEPFFDAEGRGSTATFLAAWEEVRARDPHRPVVLASADHDFDRLRCGPRTPEQLGAALTFLLTWGSVPCLYYGDEIGMRYLHGMPDVEGAVCNPLYNRAGCRTPMQWDDSPNAGFSAADPADLYLPQDPAPDRPTVAAQEGDPDSTLALVRRLVRLRRATPALRGRAPTRVVHAGYPLAYLRGERHLVVVNPRRERAPLVLRGAVGAEVLLGEGVHPAPEGLLVDGFGYGVLALA
jgi:glycosidase